MKKVFVLVIAALSIFSAGCTSAKMTEGNTEVKFTNEQEKVIAVACDESDDNMIFATTSFDDGHCYHV